MDITWGINTKLVSKKGHSFFIDPMDIWENVKILNVRTSMANIQLSDLEYKGEVFLKVPYSIFLIHN